MLYIFFGGVAAVLGIDLLTKALFSDADFTIIKGLLSFEYRPNTGAAFSMFSGNVIWLILFTTVVLIVGLFLFFKFRNKNWFFNIACILIFGGALGNLWDRVFLGYVRDFIRFDFVEFAIFNFADICLNIGVALLIVWMIFFYGKAKQVHDAKN